MKMGAAILLTAPGIPMIWMGQEFCESAPRTQERQPIDWALLQNERNADLLRTYQGLIAMRKNTPALRTDTFDVVHLDHERCIMAYKRWNDEGNVVVVVANLQDTFAGEVQLPNWPSDGKWHEYIHDYDVEVGGGTLHDSLAESEVKVYIKAG
jgi:1,4-alpha-glucan branching enzyme